MKVNIREVLDDCIAQGIDTGYHRAYKYNDNPSRADFVGSIEDEIWLEIDRHFDFQRNVCNEVIEGFDQLGKKRSHKEFLQDLDDWAMSDKREWVGLTENDIQAVLKEWVQTQMTVREMVREAEAKLKEKNSQ